MAAAAVAGPLEFGKSELNAALARAEMEPAIFRFTTEITGDPTECYRIEGTASSRRSPWTHVRLLEGCGAGSRRR